MKTRRQRSRHFSLFISMSIERFITHSVSSIVYIHYGRRNRDRVIYRLIIMLFRPPSFPRVSSAQSLTSPINSRFTCEVSIYPPHLLPSFSRGLSLLRVRFWGATCSGSQECWGFGVVERRAVHVLNTREGSSELRGPGGTEESWVKVPSTYTVSWMT